jgi:hypothetical protein
MAADIGTLTPEQLLQQQQILRQQKMAEMLMQQTAPQGQMIGNRYVAPSFTQNLANLANMYVGKANLADADKAQIDLARQLRADESLAMADFMQQKQGKAGVQGGIYGPDNKLTMQTTADMYGPNMALNPQYKQVAPVAAVPANPQAAYANLYSNPKASAAQRQFAFGKMNEGPMKVGIDDVLLDPNTLKPIYEGAGKLPATLDVAVSLIPNLPRNRNEWTDAQRTQVENKVRQLERDKASVTHINMPTEGERKAGFMSSILDKNILQMQNALGVDPKAIKPNVPASVVEAITGPNLLSRSMKPEQRQIVEDSQLDVLDAALTLRTGAAYTREQLNAMRDTYFPVLGDKPPAIAAKKQRLETLLEGAYIASGRATPPRVSNPPPVNPPAPNINRELNLPSVNPPKFLGFENANR